MYSGINSITPRFFPNLPPKTVRLTNTDFTTPRSQVPQTQRVLSPHEKTPEPVREILMAAALAYQGPVMAKSLIEEAKRNESNNLKPDYISAI